MLKRIGFLSVAHMHAGSYAHFLNQREEVALSGVWDEDKDRGNDFAKSHNSDVVQNLDELIKDSDAIIICSENKRHAEWIDKVAKAGKSILCEKPLVTSYEEAEQVKSSIKQNNVSLMTAFPCRFSPVYQRAKQRVKNGDIGKVLSVCATNHGSCPFDWFVEEEKSGGGAMMDHTVHVADLLRDLLESEAKSVYAQTGNQMYRKSWDDTAMLHVEFENGVFTTIDASWSRPKSYKTWGDVKMNIVGEKGVIEIDLFSQAFDLYRENHGLAGFGTSADRILVDSFIASLSGAPIVATMEDGLRASSIAIAGYESAKSNEPISLAV